MMPSNLGNDFQGGHVQRQPDQTRNNSITKPVPSARKRCRPYRHRIAPLLASSLPAPLSELNEYAHIPLVDIGTFVRRDAAIRQAEVEARRSLGGRVPRPLNPFMLYRKCYNARAAAVCKGIMRNGWRKEQQSVSAICGMSWQRETGAVTEMFREWAVLEKASHREAFPDWRFSWRPKKRSKSSMEDKTFDEDLDAPVSARVSTVSPAPAPAPDWQFGYVPLDMGFDMGHHMGHHMGPGTPFGMHLEMPDDMPTDMSLDMALEVPYMAHNMLNKMNMPFDMTQNMGYGMAPLPADRRADQIALPPITNDSRESWWPLMPGFQEQNIPQPDFQQQGAQPQCPQEITVEPAILYPQGDALQQQHASSATNQLLVGEHDVITSMADEQFRHALGNVLGGSDWDSELAWGLVESSEV